MSKKILCLGFGYAARALTRQLSGEWHVIGTTRKPDKAAEMAAEGIEPYHWDGRELSAQLVANVDAVLISTGPDDIGCPAARAAEKAYLRLSRKLAKLGVARHFGESAPCLLGRAAQALGDDHHLIKKLSSISETLYARPIPDPQ